MSDEARRIVSALQELEPDEMRALLRHIPPAHVQALDEEWPAWAHDGQLPPHRDWRVWVLLAGRGFGKTRAGAEWVSSFARASPGARIALVAATPKEARRVMIEGRSGLLAVARAGEAPKFQPSLGRLVFASGAEAYVYSGADPESLRGPEHDLAWCDELAKWRRAQAGWDNLVLGLRGGERAQVLVTTTPKPVEALKRILATEGTVLTGGATRSNPHLPEDFIRAVEAIHAGTRFGRQELEGVLIDEAEGALWTRDLIEACRAMPRPAGDYKRIVVGVDPPASVDRDACGIVVCAAGRDGIADVLADLSVAGLSPEGWARRVAGAVEAWGAHRVVAEANNGGRMVESVLRGASVNLPIRLTHASEGKIARAEPVAALFEARRARFAGAFPELEDELCAMVRGGFAGEGSPDRADALVWAMTELMLRPKRAEPRITAL
ncbi:MAG TPA: terminase family protein [Allosphingosinicella sp.]|nr:terminase family protein [Allosphingosinicella sp.]